MKTIEEDSKWGGVEVHDDTQMYKVLIDNDTKKVIKYSSECDPITLEEIQEMVDKLIRLEMLTIFGDSTTDVGINIWEIEHTSGLLEDPQELFMETYHNDPNLPDNVLFDDYNRSMNWECFLDEE